MDFKDEMKDYRDVFGEESVEKRLQNLLIKQKGIAEEIENIKEQLQGNMINTGINEISGEFVKIIYVQPSVSKRVDTARLKKDGLYEQYTTESKRKGHTRMSLIDKE